MQFGPRFHKTLLSERKRARNQFDRIQAVNRHRLLIVSVEVRQMMWSKWLRIHADNNPKKPRKFRHSWPNIRPTSTVGKCLLWRSHQRPHAVYNLRRKPRRLSAAVIVRMTPPHPADRAQACIKPGSERLPYQSPKCSRSSHDT